MYALLTRHYLILEFTFCPEIHHIWSIKKIKLFFFLAPLNSDIHGLTTTALKELTL